MSESSATPPTEFFRVIAAACDPRGLEPAAWAKLGPPMANVGSLRLAWVEFMGVMSLKVGLPGVSGCSSDG